MILSEKKDSYQQIALIACCEDRKSSALATDHYSLTSAEHYVDLWLQITALADRQTQG